MNEIEWAVAVAFLKTGPQCQDAVENVHVAGIGRETQAREETLQRTYINRRATLEPVHGDLVVLEGRFTGAVDENFRVMSEFSKPPGEPI